MNMTEVKAIMDMILNKTGRDTTDITVISNQLHHEHKPSNLITIDNVIKDFIGFIVSVEIMDIMGITVIANS